MKDSIFGNWAVFLLLTRCFVFVDINGAPIIHEFEQNSTYPVRLTGGTMEYEGNVEIFWRDEWASVCDDDWGIEDATVVCHQLGFPEGALKSLGDSYFGHTTPNVWLDNVGCNGHETELANCRNNGWGIHDCTPQEAAGVICKRTPTPEPPIQPEDFDKHDIANKEPLSALFNSVEPASLQITGGRNFKEGRVQLGLSGEPFHAVFCADQFTLREALVICRQLGLKFAQQAVKTHLFGDVPQNRLVIMGLYCTGNEMLIDECHAYSFDTTKTCESDSVFAGVVCNEDLPDLMPDVELVQSSVYLHDQALFYLQCAMEENCLSRSAYKEAERQNWYGNIRRLLRFSNRVFNIGTADFRPDIPKENWEWHQCHMHHHSMEVFSRYDIFDSETNLKVAEGHKASFCLEDSDCPRGITKHYDCKNFGDQGISVGCWDQYLHDIDCQWIDISDLPAGLYKLKITVNPEYRVAEMNYTNNAVICELYYNLQQIFASHCQMSAV